MGISSEDLDRGYATCNKPHFPKVSGTFETELEVAPYPRPVARSSTCDVRQSLPGLAAGVEACR